MRAALTLVLQPDLCPELLHYARVSGLKSQIDVLEGVEDVRSKAVVAGVVVEFHKRVRERCIPDWAEGEAIPLSEFCVAPGRRADTVAHVLEVGFVNVCAATVPAAAQI